MNLRTFHTVPYATGPRVEQYFAPMDCAGPTGAFLDAFHLAHCARERMTDAILSGDEPRWYREQSTFLAMVRRANRYYGG